MGWQLINSSIRIPAGIDSGNDHPESNSSTCNYYMVGTGNENGYYCFDKSPFIDPGAFYPRPFISDRYWPELHIGSSVLRQWSASYNNTQVYGGDSSDWVFLSRTQQGRWVKMGYLREPYYYTDIDDTVQGDVFYRGNMPTLNSDTPEQWEIQGAYSQWQEGDTISVELKQNVWIWQNNGNRNLRSSGVCGKYYNEQDGSWKMVGVPTFSTSVTSPSCYVYREKFTRGQKIDRHFVYEGDKGHTIHYKAGQWIMGTVGSGNWSEGDEPSLHAGNEVEFKGYEIDEGTGEQVPDTKGNFKIAFECCVMGSQKGLVNMGEVSLWRPKI